MPLAVYTITHPWVQSVVREVRDEIAPEWDVAFLKPGDQAGAQTLLPKADALLCLKCSAEWIGLLDRCKLVQHNGVGYDGIDRVALNDRGIPLAITPVGTAVGVAEHVFMLMLSLSKQLLPVHKSLQNGTWEMMGWRANSTWVHQRTLGIVGLGRIGKRVAHLAHAFGTKTLYTDIVPMPAELEERYALERVELDELIERSDIVTVHVPLTEKTNGMFGSAEFERMKSDALFINASRGETYDMDALYNALVAGQLRGAGLDVFNPEPPNQHPILYLDNVVATSHIASGTIERQYAIVRAQFENFQRALRGEAVEDQIIFGG
ncbi:MAG: NAD(P)-dependent oxidoreductase [Candidatus Promineifilaceae bacterium]